MKISDLQIGRGYDLNLVPALAGEKFTFSEKFKDKPCFIFEYQGEAFIECEGLTIAVACKKATEQSDLEELLRDRDRSLICMIYCSDVEVSISARVFADCYSTPEPIDLAIGDVLMDDIQKRYKKIGSSPGRILEWLKKQCVIDTGREQESILVSQGPEAAGSASAFRVFGNEVMVDVRRNEVGQLELTRILNRSRPKPADSFPIALLKAPKIEVKDITIAAKTRESVQQEMNAIVASGAAYISLWEEYNQLEREKAEGISIEVGKIQYDQWRFDAQKEAYWFKIRSPWTTVEQFLAVARDNQVSIEADDNVPYFLRGIPREVEQGAKKRRWIGELVETRESASEVLWRHSKRDEHPKLPEEGFLFGSMLGTEIMMQRREKASEIIRSGTAPLPQISLILEDRPVQTRTARSIPPISSAVRRAFSNPFNPKQQEAISLALNTPDIALIQGPPGTGKTQVIAAICIRLAEEAKARNESPSKMVLLTAFQHDAVANVAERTRVMGLPSIKVDKNASSSEIIDRWSLHVRDEIKSQLAIWPQSAVREIRKQVLKSYQFFKKTNLSPIECAKLLRETKSLVGDLVSPELLKAIHDEIHDLSTPVPIAADSIRVEAVLKAIRGVRTTKEAWSDDGPMAIRKLLSRLQQGENVGDSETTDWLRELLDREPSPVDFEKLQECKEDLLSQFSDASLSQDLQAPSNKMETIFVSILDTLNEKIENSPDGIQAVLETYLEDLTDDVDAAREAISAYSAVLAATVQGSDSFHVSNALGGMDQVFDTVIVDEAARVNPLDLFIALTKAKRRIVLVGDHRQLPQILEPELEESLIESQSRKNKIQDVKAALEMSLFERLFQHLKKQEATDGRKRTITLNEQYRMHPALGTFVSQTFYEARGDGQIENRTDAIKLDHPFKQFTGKVAVWKHIPLREGKEQKAGSICRIAEAKAAISLLAELMEAAPDLSFGVITFYSAQVTALLKEGVRHGLTSKDETGQLVIAENHRLTERNEERLRIGSVDAFQGKEFDVVILSTVRSNDFPIDLDEPKSTRRKYGFLTLENRLNVAMSRAKRLLIAVGDMTMFDLPEAKECVPGLFHFLQFTRDTHGKKRN